MGIERKVAQVRAIRRDIHQRRINHLAERLKRSEVPYSEIRKNLTYGGTRQGVEGEIDLLAKYKNYVLIFEVKTRGSLNEYMKALDQLERAKKQFEERVFTFYDSPSGIQWIT